MKKKPLTRSEKIQYLQNIAAGKTTATDLIGEVQNHFVFDVDEVAGTVLHLKGNGIELPVTRIQFEAIKAKALSENFNEMHCRWGLGNSEFILLIHPDTSKDDISN